MPSQDRPRGDHVMESTWHRPGLMDAILSSLQAAGMDLDTLSVEDLAPLDQFHHEGRTATLALARLAGLTPGLQVLDVGGGLGGAARTPAVEFGCRLTVLDPTADYLDAGRTLTSFLHREDQVQFQEGDGLTLPFGDESFDVVWTQNTGMNIQDKAALYRGFHRVLRPAGHLALQAPAAGPVQPPHFPLMWASDSSASFLATPSELHDLNLSAGFVERAWEERPQTPLSPVTGPVPQAMATIQQLVRGDELPAVRHTNERNREEHRMTMVQALFERS